MPESFRETVRAAVNDAAPWVYLLIWEAVYGDEGEGRHYAAVFSSEAEAEHARRTWPRPTGFSAGGAYDVERVPFASLEISDTVNVQPVPDRNTNATLQLALSKTVDCARAAEAVTPEFLALCEIYISQIHAALVAAATPTEKPGSQSVISGPAPQQEAFDRA